MVVCLLDYFLNMCVCVCDLLILFGVENCFSLYLYTDCVEEVRERFVVKFW